MLAIPLRFDVPVGPDRLIDRRAELAELGRSAARRTAVRLSAPRRFGKTSLLQAHVETAREAGHRAVLVDLSDVGDLAAVVARVAYAYRDLHPSAARLVGRVTRRAGITVSPTGLALTIERGAASFPGREQLEPVLLELLDIPATLHREDGRLTVVCFDEFQDLLRGGAGLDGLLRSVIQHHGDAASYVYAGSHPSLLRALFADRERPLFGQAVPLELGPLPADATVEAAKPDIWAARAVALYQALQADALVAEVNQGGEMVRSVIATCDASVPVTAVHASRGKHARAEPVAALYAQGRVRHVGAFPALEDEMVLFGPEGLPDGRSPDRLDALVWAVTHLMLAPKARPRSLFRTAVWMLLSSEVKINTMLTPEIVRSSAHAAGSSNRAKPSALSVPSAPNATNARCCPTCVTSRPASGAPRIKPT